jgi:FUN14 domain-containing protein 1
MNSGGVGDYLKNILKDINEMPTLNQVIIGGTAGITTGYVLSKVGKIAAFTVGSSVIVLQLAQHLGYIEINWGKKKSKLEDLKKKAIKAAEEAGLTNQNNRRDKYVNQIKSFFQENVTFAASFGGGLLVGISF